MSLKVPRVLLASVLTLVASAQENPPIAIQLHIPSSIDGEAQPSLFVPADFDEARPLLVALHPWSHGYDTYVEMREWQTEAANRGWHYLQPHFRGPNNNSQACASELARQDILDAVDHVLASHNVDPERVYIAGSSGGGHMTLVMAAHAPERWAAASAWCPITDLAAWHAESKAMNTKYWRDLEAVCGGGPGASQEIDNAYRYRSPIHYLASAKDLPVDIATGIHDGHTGSVPIHHSLDAYNVIAIARNDQPIPPETIATLSQPPTPGGQASPRAANVEAQGGQASPRAAHIEAPGGRASPRAAHIEAPGGRASPRAANVEAPGGQASPRAAQDPTYPRIIHLRESTGPARVTIFEGGHEALPHAACEWLAQHARP